MYTSIVKHEGKMCVAQWVWIRLCDVICIVTVQEIAVDDINSLESEFMALQHSVQK